MPPLIRLSLAFGALLSARAVLANDIRVDVVVDFNGGGYKIVRPSPDKPAYYLPLTVGYKQVGDVVAYQKAPPPTAQVEHLLAEALFEQGYRVATRQFPPSLVFIFRWGVMSPRINRNSESIMPPQQASLQVGSLSGPRMGAQQALNMGATNLGFLGDPQYAQGESAQMLSLVAGDTLSDRGLDAVDNQNVPTAEILQMARAPRYFIMVSAYSYAGLVPFFDDWLNHKLPPRKSPRPLWEAHISTELAGHDFEEVLPTLISTAAPMLGHETLTPQLITASPVPMGHVIVGTPVLKPAGPAPTLEPKAAP